MEKQEALSKCEDLASQANKWIIEECARLLNSGAVDCDDFAPGTYGLSKVILTVAMENAAQQLYFLPGTQKELSIVLRNLRKI